MEGLERQNTKKAESVEGEPRTKILLLTSDSMGEHSSVVVAVQIDKEFDIQAAKSEFEDSLTPEQQSAKEIVDHPLHEDFAEWLINKGLAKPVDVVPFHERTM